MFYFLSAKTECYRKNTGLDEIDFGTIHAGYEEGASNPKRSMYIQWNEGNRYEIGKYASTNGLAAAVKKFKQRFPTLNESTIQTFRARIEIAYRKGTTAQKALPKYQSKMGSHCS